MPDLKKPQKGEPITTLWRYVADLVKVTNSLLNMHAKMESKLMTGIGVLRVIEGSSELRISGPSGPTGTNKKNTTIIIVSSANPCFFDSPVHWTASVATDATGTIQFYSDGIAFGSPVTVTGGIAVSAIRQDLAIGNRAIQAHYSGDAQYFDAWGNLLQEIDPLDAPVASLVLVIGSNPSNDGDNLGWELDLVFPDPIPPAPMPYGNIRFFIDGNAFGGLIAIVAGIDNQHWKASSGSISTLVPGFHNIDGMYLGNGDYSSVDSELTQHVLVVITPPPRQTTCLVESSFNPSIFNSQVNWKATISPSIATGTVQFFADGIPFGGPRVVGNGGPGIAISTVRNDLTAGFHLITAQYSGDANYDPSSGGMNQEVDELAGPHITVAPSSNPADFGATINWAAHLAFDNTIPPWPVPDGVIRFRVDHLGFGVLVPVTFSGGVWQAQSENRSDLVVGDHDVSAEFINDTNYPDKVGAITETIKPMETSYKITDHGWSGITGIDQQLGLNRNTAGSSATPVFIVPVTNAQWIMPQLLLGGLCTIQFDANTWVPGDPGGAPTIAHIILLPQGIPGTVHGTVIVQFTVSLAIKDALTGEFATDLTGDWPAGGTNPREIFFQQTVNLTFP
jgi:hypothetical protein